MARVYLDTSFFIGLLENQKNRQEEARNILEYERASDRFTSELTLNEFMVRVYDRHKNDPDCAERIEAIERQIRSIARVVAIADDIPKEAARLQSKHGEIHKHPAPPKEPRDRKFRWDAIHLATARTLNCDRIYAWDGKWEKLPEEIKASIGGHIIAPARCPGLFSVLEPEPPEAESQQATVSGEAEEVTAPKEPEVPGEESLKDPGASSSQPNEQPLPSEQSPAAPPVLASQPEPAPPSDRPDGQEQQQQPGEDLPAAPPPVGEGPSLSVQTPPEKPES